MPLRSRHSLLEQLTRPAVTEKIAIMNQAVEDRDTLLERERENVSQLRQQLQTSQNTQSALEALQLHVESMSQKLNDLQEKNVADLQSSHDRANSKCVIA
jgi:hypothetical protein